MISYLKNKWGIVSLWQFWTIIVVFSVTGSSTLLIKKPIFRWLQIKEETEWWVEAPLYAITILPSYFILLLFWGWIFGQFTFFKNFEKRTFSRFIPGKKLKSKVLVQEK